MGVNATSEALFLQAPPEENRDLLSGEEFSPVIHSLINSAAHLRMDVFKLSGWLLSESALHRWLSSQSNLNELIGIDIHPSRTVHDIDALLPSLRTLRCDSPVTAYAILPSHHLDTLEVLDYIRADQLKPMYSAIKSCPEPLNSLPKLPY